MKHPFRLSIVALLALTLLLAACNQPTVEAPPTGFITLSLKLEGATLNNRGALQPLGIPNDPSTGNNALHSVRVTVTDKNNDTVSFRNEAGTWVATESGQGYLMLDETGSAEVSLPSHLEPYTFESVGRDSSDHAIAYHSTDQLTISEEPTVQITLTSVLGDAVMVPRLPTNIIAPGEILDLMLVVMANGNDDYPDDYLQVPLGDYTVDYDLDAAANVTLVSESHRGIRLQVGDYCPDILISGTVAGYRKTGGTFHKDRPRALTLLNAPECLAGSLEADTENPEVTLSYDSATRLATGTANDNQRIELVEIYDGPVLVATTDLDVVDVNPDVAEIEFVGTLYRADLLVDPVGGLEAFAYDAAGNEATSEETPAPMTIDVNEGDSVQIALDSVADGGTITLPPGTFTEPLTITNSVTIEGDPNGGTVITPAGITSSGLNFALQSTTDARTGKAILEITGAGVEVSISNVTIKGEGGTSCADYFAGVRVSYGASLILNNSEVTDIADGFASCGVGIQVGRNITTETHSYNEQYSGTATLNNVKLSNFGKSAIVIEHPDTTVHIDGGEITGIGETDRGAQNGVQISRGGNAEIRNMTIQGVDFYRATGSDDTAAGILLFEPGTDVVLEDNTIRESGNGITILRQATGGTLTITGNVFENNRTHVENANPQEVDLSDNTFDGRKPNEMDLQELLDLEDKIEHVLDRQEPLTGWWKPQPEDYGLVRVVSNNLYVTEASGSIQRAIAAASPGDTIHIAGNGDFRAEGKLTIDVPNLTINGYGATVQSAEITADGVTLNDLNLEHSSHALILSDASGITLKDVNIDTPAMGIRFLNPQGNADYSGFSMTGGSIQNANIGISLEHAAEYAGSTSHVSEPIVFDDVTIVGVEFSDISFKGIYLEALSNAEFDLLNFENVGNEGYSDDSNPGAWGAAIDINLKYGNYSNVSLSDIKVKDSGYSQGKDTGAAVTIKARDDGSYSTNPATLDTVTIEGLNVSSEPANEPYAALRFGELNKSNEGPSNVTVSDSRLQGEYAIMNFTKATVDASDANNEFHGYIMPGSGNVLTN